MSANTSKEIIKKTYTGIVSEEVVISLPVHTTEPIFEVKIEDFVGGSIDIEILDSVDGKNYFTLNDFGILNANGSTRYYPTRSFGQYIKAIISTVGGTDLKASASLFHCSAK